MAVKAGPNFLLFRTEFVYAASRSVSQTAIPYVRKNGKSDVGDIFMGYWVSENNDVKSKGSSSFVLADRGWTVFSCFFFGSMYCMGSMGSMALCEVALNPNRIRGESDHYCIFNLCGRKKGLYLVFIVVWLCFFFYFQRGAHVDT